MTTNDIRQRIGLDGSDQVKQQLNDLGDAGKAAFQKLQDGAKATDALTALGPAFEAIRVKAVAVSAAFSDVGNSFSDLGGSIKTAITSTTLLVGAVAGAAGGFVALVTRSAESTAALQETAAAVGLTVEQFQALSFAFAQNGVGQDQFTRAMATFDRALANVDKQGESFTKSVNALNREFALGQITGAQYNKSLQDLQFQASQNVNAFTRLGVAIVRNDDGSANNEATLRRVADAFASMSDGAKKSGLALQLFGNRNLDMIHGLDKGSASFDAYNKEMQRIAPGPTKGAQEAAVNLTVAMSRLKASFNSVESASLAQFYTPLADLVNAFTEAIVANRDQIIGFAIDIAGKVRPIVFDLIQLLRGAPITDGFVASARDQIVELGTQTKAAVVDIIIPALKLLLELLDQTAKAINSVFGTNFTGTTLAAALVITKLTGLMGILRTSILLVVNVVKLFAVAFGAVEVAIAAIGFAIGFFGVTLFEQIGGWQGLWDAFWKGLGIIAQEALNGVVAIVQGIGNGIAAVFDGIVGAVENSFTTLGGFVSTTFATIVSIASDAVTSIVAFFVGIGTSIGAAFSAFGSFVGGIWTGIVTGATTAATAIATGFNTAVTGIVGFFTNLPANIATAFAAVLQLATDTWNGILAEANTILQGVVAAFNTAVTTVEGYFTGLSDTVLGILQSIENAANSVANALSSAFGSASGGGAGGGGQGFARGGMVRGGGSSTSDSISARLSSGEFVQRAAAVRTYGPDVMAALNSLRAPVDLIRAAIRGVDLGGLGQSFMPQTHFASGGLVTAAATASVGGSSGRTFNIVLGGEMFAGLTGPEHVLSSLERGASRAHIRSAGRKPTWFGR